jgi:hypothetical protein
MFDLKEKISTLEKNDGKNISGIPPPPLLPPQLILFLSVNNWKVQISGRDAETKTVYN